MIYDSESTYREQYRRRPCLHALLRERFGTASPCGNPNDDHAAFCPTHRICPRTTPNKVTNDHNRTRTA